VVSVLRLKGVDVVSRSLVTQIIVWDFLGKKGGKEVKPAS